MSPSLESELVSNGGWGLARRSPQRPGRRVLFSAALSTAEEVEPGCSGARVPGLVGNPQGAVLFKGHGCSRPGRSLQVSPQPATYAIPSCLTFPAGAGVMRQTRHLHCTLSEFPSHRSCEYSQNGGCFPQVTSGDGHRSWEPGQGTTREISATASFVLQACLSASLWWVLNCTPDFKLNTQQSALCSSSQEPMGRS